MKWTTIWSLVMAGIVVSGCGGDSGGKSGPSISNNRSSPAATAEVAADSCAPLAGYFFDLLNRTNAARSQLNAAPLRFSFQLGKSAQAYAKEMATNNFFGHGATGSFQSRIQATGYTSALIGENLAAGKYTSAGAFDSWLNSPSHYSNLVNPHYTEVGFGLFDATGESAYGRYWVQHLGSGNSEGGAYLPNSCGLDALITATSAPQNVVAGRNNKQEKENVYYAASLPQSVSSEQQAIVPSHGMIPAGSLAFVVSGAAGGSGEKEVPEPTLLLGLAGLGVAIWRDRKVVKHKATKTRTTKTKATEE